MSDYFIIVMGVIVFGIVSLAVSVMIYNEAKRQQATLDKYLGHQKEKSVKQWNVKDARNTLQSKGPQTRD